MGIEWFRDLSIAVLGLVATVVLIFAAILVYRLYRTTKSTLLLVKAATRIAHDTVTLVQKGTKPLLPILGLIQDIYGGFQGVSKIFKKKSGGRGKGSE